MAEIKAADVAKLRKMTGAGMMDCKKALAETNGDFEAAVDVLRKKGQKVASKRADREATEGAVLAKSNADGTYGAMIVLNCETDFVAKNEDFLNLAYAALDAAIENRPADIEALKQLKIGDLTIAEEVVNKTGVTGEKLDLSYFESIEAAQVVPYIHPGNRLAAMVGFTKPLSEQAGKDVVMQVAAMAPIAVDKDSVSQEVIDKELEIGKELAIQEGKPADLAAKIAQGRLGKFFKENTLLAQAFIKDNKQTVKDYIKSEDKEAEVVGFKRFTLSE